MSRRGPFADRERRAIFAGEPLPPRDVARVPTVAPYYDPVTRRCPHGTRYPNECREGCGDVAPPIEVTAPVWGSGGMCESTRVEGQPCDVYSVEPLLPPGGIVNGHATRPGAGLFGRLTSEEIRAEHARQGFPPVPATNLGTCVKYGCHAPAVVDEVDTDRKPGDPRSNLLCRNHAVDPRWRK